jgi:hypothetical protein
MDKRLLLPQNQSRERDIFFVKEDRLFLQKHASAYHPKVQDYISKAQPIENLIQVLITALGAYPFWPQNVNGDRFLEPSLSHEGDDYGYQTFVSNANYFNHHVNKDPALAKGKVLAAVWNEKAKRVELIIGINPELDPDAAAEIANGNNLAFSMGAKLPFDVCSICGNNARTRMDYCDHLRYQINQIDPVTGMLVGALNPRPKFFDISRVLIPADKTAYMWEKIASPAGSALAKLSSAELAELPAKRWFDDAYLQEKVAMKTEAWQEKKAATKAAAVRKHSAITKEIPVTSVKPLFMQQLRKYMPIAKHALDASAPNLDMGMLRGFSLPQIISTMMAMAMVPKQSEAEELYHLFVGGDAPNPLQYGPHAISPMLMRRLAPIAQERSFARPVLMRRLIIMASGPEAPLHKMAAEQRHDPKSFNKGLILGIVAAAMAMSKPAGGLGNFILDHPILSAILGATAYNSIKTLGPTRPLVTGEVSLAPPDASLYNTDWQRRFVDAQARPVTVIKTGADQNTRSFDDIFGAVPFLFMLEGVSQHPAISILESNPHNLNGSLLTKEATVVARDVNDLISSASRFIKSASLESIDFLERVPENSRNLVWDLAILNAAATVARKMS